MTNKEYRDHDGISRSQLFNIATSPFHFKSAIDNPPKDTESFLFGRAAHKYILEPDSFMDEFYILPDVDGRTIEGKFQKKLAFESGKDIIRLDYFETIKKMTEVIKINPIAAKLLTGKVEQSFFWTDETTGEKCKCRPDVITLYNGEKYIVDYKTTDSCINGHFEFACRKYGYKLQAGMYTEGLFQNTFDQHGFAFVAQEKTAPYAVRVYICTPEFINQGYDQFKELIQIYHKCKLTNNWYGYEGPENIVTELLEEEN